MTSWDIMGGLGKKANPNILRVLMRYDVSQLIKAEFRVQKFGKREERSVQRHMLSKIEEEMKNIEKSVKNADDKGYKLAFRDLIMLKAAIGIVQALRVDHKAAISSIRQVLDTLNEQLKRKGAKSKAERGMKGLEQALEREENTTNSTIAKTLEEVHGELGKDQQYLYEVQEGTAKTGTTTSVKFWMKDPMNMPRPVLNFIKRFEISMLRRNLMMLIKEVKGLHEELRGVRTEVEALQGKLEGINEAKFSSEAGKIKEKLSKIEKKVPDLEERALKTLKEAYRIFVFTFLMLHNLIVKVEEFEEHDRQWVAEHKIPEKLGMDDYAQLKKSQEHLKQRLQKLHVFLNQLWQTSKA